MNSTIKTQWLAALRSGQYQQGREWLRNGDAYCCLGVLCDLHAQAHVNLFCQWEPIQDAVAQEYPTLAKQHDLSHVYRYHDKHSDLPTPVQQWSGLQSFGDIDTLVDMNDQGESFTAIAAWIEEHL